MNKFEKTLHFIKDHIQPDSPFYQKIYLVGGCVRDELLGERYSDLDLLINLPNGQKEFVEHLCATYPGTCKGPFYYQRYGTTAMDVIIDGVMTLVECVEPHIEHYASDGVTLLDTRFCTLAEDAMRRDYTCNALYKNLHTGQVLDPTGLGLADLKEGLLRTPLTPDVIYRQDPVRMLRGIRFKHQKGFRLDPAAWQAIIDNHEEMQNAAPKRLRDELNKILKTSTCGEAIQDLYRCGLLPYIMPGFNQVIEDQTPIPYLDSEITPWEHTRTALRMLADNYPHADTVNKLAILSLHTTERHGAAATTRILLDSQIGKEKIGTITHLSEMYIRYRSFYKDGQYIARPRALPHFILGLGKSVDNFRALVRTFNNGTKPEAVLPYDRLYSRVKTATPAGSADSGDKGSSTTGRRTSSGSRTRKRREQRKRAQRRRAASKETR